jgi:uncharacterized membrane protein
MLTLTPDAQIPLNSTLSATITATLGMPDLPFPRKVSIPVHVVVPGATAIATATVAVQQLEKPDLANRLRDLSVALTRLVQTGCDDVSRSQSRAALDAINVLIGADPMLAPFADPFRSGRNALAAAATPAACIAQVQSLGFTIDNFAVTVTDLAAHNFELFLIPSSQIVQPLVPANFELRIHNIGTETTTYDLQLFGLTSEYTGGLSQSRVTLARDEFSSVMVTITQTVADSLVPLDFVIDVTVANAPHGSIFKEISGALTVRQEFVSVVSVTPTPAFTDAGGMVAVSARVLNAVNLERPTRASFVVRDTNGTQIGRASTPVEITLGVLTSLATVDLGTIDTTGFASGSYTIEVAITDLAGETIPGATGAGNFLVGSPVTASITVGPDSVPPGTSSVTNTLTIDSRVPLDAPFSVLGQAFLPGANMPVRNGDLVYVAGNSGISVFDVADPANPQFVRTVGQAANVIRVEGDRLIALRGGNTTRVSVYSLADAANPQLLGSTPETPIHFANDLVVSGNTAFVSTIAFTFNIFSNEIFEQSGEVLAVDLSNPAAPQFASQLFNTNPNGGDFNIFQEVIVDPQTLWVATTTATGSTVSGTGVIRIVDITDATQMSIVREVPIPGAAMVTGVAFHGNRAFVTASTEGFHPTAGLMGNIILATLDATDHRDPQVIDTQSLGRASRGIGDAVSLGNQMYAFSSLGALHDRPQLILADASDPMHVATSGLDVPSEIGAFTAANNLIYTASAAGLIIYQTGGVASIPATAAVQIPKNTGVSVVANSFSVAPTQIIPGDDFDTLRWQTTLSNSDPSRTFTWQSLVTDLDAGALRAVTLSTIVDFMSQGTSGQTKLPPQKVVAEHLIAIDPASRTVRPGEATMFNLTLRSPSNASTVYFLDAPGVPREWVSLPDPGFLLPNQSVTIPLTIQPDPFAVLDDYDFVVIASSSGGISDFVHARLTVAGEPLLADADPDSHGVVVTVLPPQADAGQGTAAAFVVRITNTGSVAETFDLSQAGLPAEFTASFTQNGASVSRIEVPPGASNFRDVSLAIVPPLGTIPADYAFTVNALSTTDANVSDSSDGLVTVLPLGVQAEITPSASAPGGTFQLRVTNTGQATDSFDLSLAAPVALVASLGTNSVTLAPGESQVVPINVGTVNFAFPGSLTLVAVARSRSNSAVQDAAMADVTIAATHEMAAEFDPAIRTLSSPGETTFLLLVHNSGNLEEAFTATIAGTNGPVAASLAGLDGQPSQTITNFRLPGLSTAAILLKTVSTAIGQGTVDVQVMSLDTGNRLTARALAIVQAPALPGVTVDPTSALVTTESGVQAIFTVVLNSVPTADVTIDLASSDASEGTVLPTRLIFTPQNALFPQTVRSPA